MPTSKSSLRSLSGPKFLSGGRSGLASSKTSTGGNSKNSGKLSVDSARRKHLAPAGIGQTMEGALDPATRNRSDQRSVTAVPAAPSDYQISRLLKCLPRSRSRSTSGKLPLADHCFDLRPADAISASACSGGDSGDGALAGKPQPGIWIRALIAGYSFPLDSSRVEQRALPTVLCKL